MTSSDAGAILLEGEVGRGTLVLNRRQCKALLSPVRMGIAEFLEHAGAASIRHIAAALGRPRHSLYHHVRILQSVGILEVAETRLSGVKEEAVFDLAGRPLVLGTLAESKANRDLRVRSVRLILRQTERDYARAIEARAHTENNAKQVVQVRRHLARLEPEALARVSHHLDAVHEILRESGGTTDGRLFAWTSAIVPLSNTGGIQS